MAGLGFVRSELEIKTLTLFVLDYIDMSVSFDELMQMAFVDDAMNYFNFAEYLNGMVSTGHVGQNSDSGLDRYSITAKGKRDLAAIKSSVPGSVLRKAEKACDNVREAIIRKNLVNVRIDPEGDAFRVFCSLSDESGEIFSFSMSAATRESAKELTANFYNNAEKIYNAFLGEILRPGK